MHQTKLQRKSESAMKISARMEITERSSIVSEKLISPESAAFTLGKNIIASEKTAQTA